ncbi:universal stress protein [Galbitalea soli]|uniref:Universal stress protein n=1 Tax=Galbitalea soli TaxID=1268042 RepID=A0A7C9PLC2_9MICO|nr:universal stress protein [Galbitalea soli]NYJ30773.1 nucleotide-binding universal stress UspA family protein [Galbitalea soli]
MTGRILVGADGSGPSRQAVTWAGRRARETGETIILVGVQDGRHPDLLAELETESEALRRNAPTAQVETLVLSGDPMTRLASEAGADDMVVIGTHKTGFIRGRVFGSSGLRLAALTHATVVVMPSSSGGARSGIVVGVRDSLASVAALDFAGREARRTSEMLTVIAVDDETAVDIARDYLRAEFPDLASFIRLLRHHPAERLVEAAERASLTVLGSTPADEGPRVLGPVVHDVLLNITGPTALVRPAPTLGTHARAGSDRVVAHHLGEGGQP